MDSERFVDDVSKMSDRHLTCRDVGHVWDYDRDPQGNAHPWFVYARDGGRRNGRILEVARTVICGGNHWDRQPRGCGSDRLQVVEYPSYRHLRYTRHYPDGYLFKNPGVVAPSREDCRREFGSRQKVIER